MKKIILICILAAAIIGGYCGMQAGKTPFYLNAADEASYAKLNLLKKAIEKEGKRVILSRPGKHKSGNFTLYAADDVNHLPEVIDTQAINLLWIPKHPNREKPELLRPYDVIVMKNIPDYNHLKAINVRTAYIPNAVDVKNKDIREGNGRTMYYGDYNGFSLPLYLAGPTNIAVDIYGKGFEKMWSPEEIKGDKPSLKNIQEYGLVLIDQDEADITSEFVEDKILEVISKGGLPYVRHNSGLYKMFGDTVPMYINGEMFEPELRRLLGNPEELKIRKQALRYLSQQWDSRSQARKFIEIFELMSLKRR